MNNKLSKESSKYLKKLQKELKKISDNGVNIICSSKDPKLFIKDKKESKPIYFENEDGSFGGMIV